MRTKEKSATLFGSCGFFCIFAARSQKNEKRIMAKNNRKPSKISVNLSRGKVSTHRGVTVGKDHVTVRYRACGENRVVKIPNDSIIASGRAALAKVPVIFD